MTPISEKDLAIQLHNDYQTLKKELAKVIVGQDEVIKETIISIFSKGHCLLIGVPGLAKTLLVKTIADALGLQFSRIQFTPDLMPSDILGSEILNEQKQFQFIKGPIFANIILADEINRTPPKTQSALLEAMQEQQVTVAGKLYPLPQPFFVLATQNPIEQEGTYPLPEAQLDRFMFSIQLDYPKFEEEVQIVKQTTTNQQARVSKIFSEQQIIQYQELVRKVPVTDFVVEYAVKLVQQTRDKSNNITKNWIEWGAGPRASQYLIIGAKCHALLNGKFSPDREDVNAVANAVLQHRIVLNYKAEAESIKPKEIIQQLIDSIKL
ncbi:MAG TPA: MoxR family ATPase [Bacteroidia bacterium]|nr:MoxR family ATPase [Bacteroidia bacterium]